MTTVGILGTGANRNSHYANYFAMVPLARIRSIPSPRVSSRSPRRRTRSPRPSRLSASMSEFGKNSIDGARDNAKAAGSLSSTTALSAPTTDSRPSCARSRQPIPTSSSSPLSARFGRYRPRRNETGSRPKLFAHHDRLMATPLKVQLGPLMNGIVIHEDFVPAFDSRLARAPEKNTRRSRRKRAASIRWATFRSFGYAAAQVLAKQWRRPKASISRRSPITSRSHSFSTVVGDIAFGKDGE